MKRLWSQLFPLRARRIRQAARPVRRSRLVLEAFDVRVLPSASSVLSNGILTITADNNGSNATFFSMGSNQWMVAYGDSSQTFTGPVNEVIFKGDAGNDYFANQSNVNCLVIGSPGKDTYNGGSGINLLDRNGNRVSWNTTSGQNVTFGLSDGSPAADDLSATGAMMVSLSSDHTQLSIVGPSGIGFWLDGTWEDSLSSDDNLFQHSFRPAPNSSVTLHTGSILGEIPLPRAAVAGMEITTKAEPWKDPAGEYEHVEFGSGFLPLNTEDTSASNPIVTLGKQYGLDINIPTVNWGLALGSDVMAQKSLGSAPLNSAVPYFFFVWK